MMRWMLVLTVLVAAASVLFRWLVSSSDYRQRHPYYGRKSETGMEARRRAWFP